MGAKNICISCRIAFSENYDFTKNISSQKDCPKCGQKMVLGNQKFKAPKKSDDNGWKMVKLLIENGFLFQSVYLPYKDNHSTFIKIEYPKSLEEAKQFVSQYEYGFPLKVKKQF